MKTVKFTFSTILIKTLFIKLMISIIHNVIEISIGFKIEKLDNVYFG